MFDYSQIEMRLFALLAQEYAMLEAVNNGEDLHAATAIQMFGPEKYESNPKHYRRITKAINFGIIYGMGIKALAVALGIRVAEAQILMDEYLHRFPNVLGIQNLCKNLLYRQGYVTDFFGRRYHVEPKFAYKAVNRIVQGGAANVLKWAMLQCERAITAFDLDNKVKPIIPIHDELILEVQNDSLDYAVPRIKLAMEEIEPVLRYNSIRTLVDVEFSTTTWGAKTDYTIKPTQMDRAKCDFKNHRQQIVLPLEVPHEDWFLN